jgi:hypothetical protein
MQYEPARLFKPVALEFFCDIGLNSLRGSNIGIGGCVALFLLC